MEFKTLHAIHALLKIYSHPVKRLNLRRIPLTIDPYWSERWVPLREVISCWMERAVSMSLDSVTLVSWERVCVCACAAQGESSKIWPAARLQELVLFSSRLSLQCCLLTVWFLCFDPLSLAHPLTPSLTLAHSLFAGKLRCIKYPSLTSSSFCLSSSPSHPP